MKQQNKDYFYLFVFTITGFLALKKLLKGPLLKRWCIVYFLTIAITVTVDKILVNLKFLKYPKRLLATYTDIHVVFDFLICPVITIAHNQITYKDKNFLLIILKLLIFTVPQLISEVWAVKNTNLIQWNKGWKWYHTFLSMNLKFYLIRVIMAIQDKRQLNIGL